jgi:hypothetical protein
MTPTMLPFAAAVPLMYLAFVRHRKEAVRLTLTQTRRRVRLGLG